MSSVHLEPQDLPDPAAANHGMTLAAWVLNSGLVIAAIVIGVGMMLERDIVTWIGVTLAVLALIAGGVTAAILISRRKKAVRRERDRLAAKQLEEQYVAEQSSGK